MGYVNFFTFFNTEVEYFSNIYIRVQIFSSWVMTFKCKKTLIL